MQVEDCRTVGKDARHLRLRLRQRGTAWRAIGFDLGHLADEVTPEVDIVYKLSVDRWSGQDMLELKILDFTPAR